MLALFRLEAHSPLSSLFQSIPVCSSFAQLQSWTDYIKILAYTDLALGTFHPRVCVLFLE